MKRVLESKKVVPGAGACEAAGSVFLDNFAMTVQSREQLAIAEFANALTYIPKQLVVNAGHDSTDLVAKLRQRHQKSQKDGETAPKNWYAVPRQIPWSFGCLYSYSAH